MSTVEDFRAKFTGKRVQFVGMFGNSNGLIGKVWRVTSRGVWVTYPDGHREQHHPEDIRVVR
jgi:hypothetical protein